MKNELNAMNGKKNELNTINGMENEGMKHELNAMNGMKNENTAMNPPTACRVVSCSVWVQVNSIIYSHQ